MTTLSQVCCSIVDGVHNTVDDDPNGHNYLLSCKNIKNGKLIIGSSERKIDDETYAKLRKRTKLSKGDILLTSVGTIGETYLLMNEPDGIEFQRSVAIIKPNLNLVSSEYVYLAINLCKDRIINAAHGAVQQCLFLNDLCSVKIPVVDNNIISQLTKTITPFFEIIYKNNQLSNELESIRNYLLPKLMSGEIDVSTLKMPTKLSFILPRLIMLSENESKMPTILA